MKNLIKLKFVLLTINLCLFSALVAGQAKAQSYHSGYGKSGESDLSSFANRLVSADVYLDNAVLAEQAMKLTSGAKDAY